MAEHKVPVQSLIDHIKTAVDVDPWAKEMVEELLKEQEPIAPSLEQDADGIYSTCGNCKTRLWKMFGVEFEINPDAMPKFCPQCGQAVKWNDSD